MKTVAFSELRDVAFEIRASQERSQEYRRCRVALECEMKAQRSETPMHQPNRLQTAEPLRNPNPKPALEPFQKPKCHNSEGMSLKHHITADLGFLQPATSCPATRRSWQHCKRRPFTQHLCPKSCIKTIYTLHRIRVGPCAPGFLSRVQGFRLCRDLWATKGLPESLSIYTPSTLLSSCCVQSRKTPKATDVSLERLKPQTPRYP